MAGCCTLRQATLNIRVRGGDLLLVSGHTQTTVGMTQKPLLELPQRQLYQTEVVAAKTTKPQLPTPITTAVTQSTQGEPEPRATAAATGVSAQDGQGQKKR